MEPKVVLLPGMDGTGDLFSPLIDALGLDVAATVVRYPDEPLDYTAHEDFARSALPTDRPFILVGESFSGPIAISIAARAPHDLRGYVLCSSFATCPQPILKLLRPLLGLLPPQRVPSALAAHFLMGRFATPELRQMHALALQRVSPSTLVARLKAIADVDVRHMLDRVRVPGIYLRATEDRLVPGSAAAAVSSLGSKVRVVDIEAPHFLLQANPTAAASAIREFMREVA
jgi:pimeloyl-ACP methyl ester carboxylesterase